jgi:guanine nucleotide-binding protein subunit alpha, other
MRLTFKTRHCPAEIESYRQLVFNNILRGMECLLDALDYMGSAATSKTAQYVELIRGANELREDEPFPIILLEALTALWSDPKIQAVLVWERRNEDSLLDKFVTQHSQLSSRIAYNISF